MASTTFSVMLGPAIDPADTRRAVCAALDMLASKQEALPVRKHGNPPQ